jgi:hypothetical protein
MSYMISHELLNKLVIQVMGELIEFIKSLLLTYICYISHYTSLYLYIMFPIIKGVNLNLSTRLL